MSTTVVVPQPLTGTEIKRGIALRMTEGAPDAVIETLREKIMDGLAKTCSLQPHTAYAKFKADWKMAWWKDDGSIRTSWWVKYELDDFGRVTQGAIGEKVPIEQCHGSIELEGHIEEVPPDRFRRETDQPIPRPREVKQPEPEHSSFSKAARAARKRSEV